VEKEKPEAETNTDGNDAAEPAEAGDGCGAVHLHGTSPLPIMKRGVITLSPIIIHNHGSVKNGYN